MKLKLRHGLPFAAISVRNDERSLQLEDVLVDSGSAGTVLPVDRLRLIGIEPRPSDPIRQIRGIGGVEYVFQRSVQGIEVGELKLRDFPVEIGEVDYGFSIQGILGADFLIASGALVDFSALEMGSPKSG